MNNNTFEATGPHYCPDGCSEVITTVVDKKIVKINRRQHLHIAERNVGVCSFHGVNRSYDVARCPKCGHGFRIYYKALKPCREKSRDGVPNCPVVEKVKQEEGE